MSASAITDVLAAARAEVDRIICTELAQLVDQALARGTPPDQVRAELSLRYAPSLARLRGEARRRLDALAVQADQAARLRAMAPPEHPN